MSRKTTIEYAGVEYKARLGRIDKTFLGVEDHGIFTAMLTVGGEGWGVSVGGYGLDSYVEERREREGVGFGMQQVKDIIRTVGASSWEDLGGRYCYVISRNGETYVGIAHATDEKRVLDFVEHATAWRANHDGAMA